MTKRSLIVPIVSIALAVMFTLGYLFLLTPSGIYKTEYKTDGKLCPNETAFRLLQMQLKIVPNVCKNEYYEHLLDVYYRPGTEFTYVDKKDAPAVFEAYFENRHMLSSDYCTVPSFPKKEFTDDNNQTFSPRSDDDWFVLYCQGLYAAGERERAKQLYIDHFDSAENHMYYRYFIVGLLQDRDTPPEDVQWAKAQIDSLITAIQTEEAAYQNNPSDYPGSPYRFEHYAKTAIYDLERFK